METRKEKIRKFLDERQSRLHYEHEREYATEFLNKMFQKEINKITPKQSLLKLVDQYKMALKFAKVPKLIIEHPGFIKSLPPTKEDIEWAKQKIEEFKKYKSFNK